MRQPEQVQHFDRFFADIEKRTYQIAFFAVHNETDALDIVQDAMVKLIEKYSAKSENEWGALFHTILQNKIMDHHRKEQLKKRFFFWRNDSEQFNEAADIYDLTPDNSNKNPENQAANEQLGKAAIKILETMPIRQQQAFLLRAWEGYDTQETAQIMGCSSGSVKTHFSRARKRLQQGLGGNDD